jgi:hypothetical protein
VWLDENDSGAVELRGAQVDALTGVVAEAPTTLASGPAGTREPRIAWGGLRHVPVWFDAADGSLHVRGMRRPFETVSEATLPPPAGETIVGYPALAWSGTVFGLLWETRGADDSTLYLATFAPDEPPVVHTPLASVPLSADEAGEVALAWAPERNEWGIAWRRSLVGRTGIFLARVDADDLTLNGAPIDLRVESVTARHPALASRAGVYFAAWTEQPRGDELPMWSVAVDCR